MVITIPRSSDELSGTKDLLDSPPARASGEVPFSSSNRRFNMKIFSISSKKIKMSPAVAASFILLFSAAPFGQATNQSNDLWQSVEERSIDQSAKRLIVPKVYRTVRLDHAALAQALASAPMEFTQDPSQNPIIHLPMPDGSLARFRFEESPIIEPGLAAKYPELKTYRAQGIDDPTATLRFDWLPTGFHAMVLSASGTVLIDPYARASDQLHHLLEARRSEHGGVVRVSLRDPRSACRCPQRRGQRRL